MNDLQIFNSDEFGEIRAYLDADNVAWFNAADVAHGLGFTEMKNGVEYIRWRTINGYLREFGFSQPVAKDDFIPENAFYRLAMKANNEAAQKFQAYVSDVILPSIRKHGVYMTPAAIEEALFNPDFIIKLATDLKRERERNAILKPKADYYDAVLTSDDAVPIRIIAKEYGMSAAALNKLLHSEQVQYMCGETWVLYRKYDRRGYVVTKTLVVGDKTKMHTYWTQKGREFLYHFLKARNIIPLRERPAEMNLFADAQPEKEIQHG